MDGVSQQLNISQQRLPTMREDKHNNQSAYPCISCEHKHRFLYILIVEVLSIFALVIGVLWQSSAATTIRDHDHIVATNAYSPFLQRQEIHLKDVTLKSSFNNSHNLPPSIWRQSPSPDVDAAWQYIHDGGRLFLISKEEVQRLGKDPEYAIQAPEEWGMDPGGYLAVSQGLHDIHCLNNIRKFVYSDYYYGGERIWQTETHFQHCLHTILQSLMCKFSTDVYTAIWVEGNDYPVIDFNLNRKCQDYDNILLWEPDQPYTDDEFYALKPPPDAKKRPSNIF